MRSKFYPSADVVAMIVLLLEYGAGLKSVCGSEKALYAAANSGQIDVVK